MEYAIFPMQSINITNRYSSSHNAWDLGGEGWATKEYWRAPCRVKVLKILTPPNGSNTVLFGTCNEAGNQERVLCEDGIARILTFACTHMDSIDRFGLAEGKIYHSGEVCYQEGEFGNTQGNHVHMEVAEGWQYEKEWVNGQYILKNMTDVIKNVFYRLDGWNIDVDLNGYTFKSVSSRSVPYLRMRVNAGTVELKTDVVSGNVITGITAGNSFNVIGLYSWNAPDGYKWGYGKYNNSEGFFRYNPNIMNPVGVCAGYKMKLHGSAARIRSSVLGTILTTVPNGGEIQILEFLSSKASDGYYWCRGIGNGVQGYFQYDPAVMYPTND